MTLNRLHLISFGKFANQEIDFDEFTVLYGPNEAGKTTVVDAIAGVLYGFKGRKDELKRMKHRYQPWNRSIYKAGLTITVDGLGQLYLERDLQTNKAEVYIVGDGSRRPAGLSIEEITRNYLGAGNLQLFKSTMLMRQEEISMLARDEVSAVLSRKIVSGDGASIKTVFRALGRKYHELNRGLQRGAGNNGPIKECQDEIRMLESRLQAMDGVAGEYDKMLKQAETLQEKIFTVKKRLQELTTLLGQQRRQAELTAEQARLLERQEEIQCKLDRVRQSCAELGEVQHYLKTKEPYLEYLSDAVLRRINHIEKRLLTISEGIQFNRKNVEYLKGTQRQLYRELERETSRYTAGETEMFTFERLLEAERLSGQIAELEKERYNAHSAGNDPTETVTKGRSGLFLGLGICLCIAALAGIFIKTTNGYIFAAVLLFAGIVSVAAGLRKGNAATNDKTGLIRGTGARNIEEIIAGYRQQLANLTGNEDIQVFRQRVNAYEESQKRIYSVKNQIAALDLDKYNSEESGLSDEYRELSREMDYLLGRTGTGSADEYRELYEQYWQTRKRQNELNERIGQVLGESDETALSREMSALGVKLHNIQTQIEAIPGQLTEDEAQAMAMEEAEKQANLEAMEKELIRVQTSIADYAQLALNNHDRWSLENRLQARKAEMKVLETKRKGIIEAVKILREAVREAESDIIPKVGERASGIITAVTGGRYSGLGLSLEAAEISIAATATEGQTKIEPVYLSTGTRDQIYLALRVAVAEKLAGGRCPLILDDPFINFDRGRLQNTVEFLRQISREHQIIMLTKDPLYMELCDGMVVALEG